MRRVLAAAAVVLSVLALTSACGDDEAAPTNTTSPAKPFEISFLGETVTPSGAEETISRGSDIELVIEADKPGELHVHSSPEQELEYDAGTTTIPVKLSNQPPGVIDIESHDLDVVVIRLTIR